MAIRELQKSYIPTRDEVRKLIDELTVVKDAEDGGFVIPSVFHYDAADAICSGYDSGIELEQIIGTFRYYSVSFNILNVLNPDGDGIKVVDPINLEEDEGGSDA